MRLQLVRNATLRLEYADRALLVDPCLDPGRSWPPIAGILNPQPNPLCELPDPAERIVAGIDGALVSHLHIDHWDTTARRLLPRELPLACQPADHDALRADGFTQLHVCRAAPGRWLALDLAGTSGHHSNGRSRPLLDPVSGFLLHAPREPALWIVGDSVWCEQLEAVLERRQPDVIVVNAGAARQLDGERITMDADDVRQILDAAPAAVVVAVHFEALGHCTLSRAQLRTALGSHRSRLLIPDDGDWIDVRLSADRRVWTVDRPQ